MKSIDRVLDYLTNAKGNCEFNGDPHVGPKPKYWQAPKMKRRILYLAPWPIRLWADMKANFIRTGGPAVCETASDYYPQRAWELSRVSLFCLLVRQIKDAFVGTHNARNKRADQEGAEHCGFGGCPAHIQATTVPGHAGSDIGTP